MVDYYFKLKQFLTTLLPQTCALCSSPTVDTAICYECTKQLPVINQSCRVCGISLPYTTTCHNCLQNAPAYDQCTAALQYNYPVARLIQAIKYQSQLQLLPCLVQLLALRLRNSAALPECLVPVPSHFRRLSWRGYNQAELIARQLSQELHIPVSNQLVSRKQYTKEQARLKTAQRKTNVHKAFKAQAKINHSHVAIIDDVVTTGATCNEIARLLKRAGAKRIEVWTLARASVS